MSEQLILEKAKHVVEKLLKVDGFVEKNQGRIFKTIENMENRALALSVRSEEGNTNVDEVFFVISLPLISCIVQVGCEPSNFDDAKRHIVELLPEVDAVTGLSALTLIYVVEKAWKQHKDSGEEHERRIWECIRGRVSRLL